MCCLMRSSWCNFARYLLGTPPSEELERSSKIIYSFFGERVFKLETSAKVQSETWLEVETCVQPTLTTETCRRLGIEAQQTVAGEVWASQALRVLGPDSFAEFSVVRTEGKVIWCNFDLARQLGFEVPPSNQLTPAFHHELLASLSVRVVGAAEAVAGQTMITMYADRYGGDGVRPGLGAGRAGFLPQGNLYLKGVGFTPLFRHNDPNDFPHSHGAAHLEDCLVEALFGEVNENLYTLGTTRVLAIIDQGKSVIHPSGRRISMALLVRTGAQLRPAHLLVNHKQRKQTLLSRFISLTSATGQLVTRRHAATGRERADVKATLLRIVDDHARTAAEGFRWRMLHGALSSSNMEMSGAMLDLATQSSQPRTAPIWLMDFAESVFGTEHISRALRLIPMHRKLLRETSPAQRKRFNIKWLDLKKQMEKAYHSHLQVKLLGACGLKAEVAERLQAEHPALASRFTDIVLEMAALKNPGTLCLVKSIVERVSVLDVFQLLKHFPSVYFAAPAANHARKILKYLKPVFSGNRIHVAKKETTVKLLVSNFAACYSELMETCANYAEEYYGDLESMRFSIATRAAFENEPFAALYYYRLHRGIKKLIAVYESKRDPELLRQAIDRRIAASLRNVDALLAQGSARRLADGGVELERRTIAGINYSVRAWNDAAQTRRLHVSLRVERSGARYSTAVAGLCCLTKRQLQALRYRFTTDGWKSFAEVGARLKYDKSDGLLLDFDDLCDFPAIGRLEGSFHAPGSGNARASDATARFGGFVFAIPDQQELSKFLAGFK